MATLRPVHEAGLELRPVPFTELHQPSRRIPERQLLFDVGGFREGYEGSPSRLGSGIALHPERLAPADIGHIPRVLYHWRAIPGSTAMAVDEKSYARTAGMKAIAEHLRRVNANAEVQEIDGRPGNFRVSYALPAPSPKISLIIPTRDGLHLLRRCIDSILTLTTYDNYEIVIVDNQSEDPATLQYLRDVVVDPRVSVIAYDHPFNYSALNNYAVRQTSGELVGLVNNDIEVISPDWLQEMAGHAMRPEIGAVGAMLYYPDDTIQHAGVVLGVHRVVGACLLRQASWLSRADGSGQARPGHERGDCGLSVDSTCGFRRSERSGRILAGGIQRYRFLPACTAAWLS